MRWLLVIGWTILAVSFGATPVAAEKRVALVIGNAAYRNAAVLPNPTNDASDVATSLRRLGFAVTQTANLAFDDMRRALIAFGRQSRGAEIALVFFAGHGMEIGGENWLIPTDAELRSDTDAENEAVSLRSVMLQVSHASKLGLVILDACRNNPFAVKMQRSARVRAVERGLVRTEPSDNVLVAYAARDGTTANDGSGRNSPFTTALLRHIETPGLEITFLFRNVRDDVMAATRREQQPFVYGSLSREQIYLTASPVAASSASTAPVIGEAERAWAITKDSTSILLLEEFARRYADSFYAAHARVRIEELKKRQVAVVVPPVPPGAPPNAGPRPTFGVYLEAPKPVPGVTPLSVARERALQPKETFKECDACPEMVVIPRGTFTMGSPAAEKERESHEGPQRLVTFSRQLAVGVFAVTFDEWDACVAGGGCGHRPADQGWGRGRRPVINVSWKDANAYLLWLSRKTGKTYRLLSEAEREYVARAGTTTPFWWGSSISSSQANYDGNYTYNDGPKGERRGRTVPVDSFLPNPFGLYQVHGNVWEWTGDCWNDSHSGAATDGAALITAGCRDRVLRGGSWDKGPLRLRSACRDRGHPDVRSDYLGFRVARTLDP